MRLNYNFLKWSLKARTFIAGGVWLIVGIIAFFCSQTGHQFTNWAQNGINTIFQKGNCHLQQVQVVWQNEFHYTKTETILKTIGLQQGTQMSSIDLKEIQSKVKQLPWVRMAVVERYWPNEIKITIEEKIPLALWQNNHKYHPLDEQAEIIKTNTQLPADLLLVVGPDAPKHLIELIKNLEQVPQIYQYVRAAVRFGERRWNLKLFNAEHGLEILLPEKDVLQALQRLDQHNKEEKIIKRQLAAIDLRTQDKVILKPIPTPSKKPKAKKK